MRRIPRVLALAVVVLLLALPCRALAYETMNDHVLNGGVGNYGYNDRYYFVASGAQQYDTYIHNAMHDWIYTTSRLGITTPISWLETSTQSSSVMDLHAANYWGSNGTIAETSYWTYDTQKNPETSNWGWGKIKINTPVFNGLSSFNREGSCAHEMGHVMGLDENNTMPQSVMCQLMYGRTVNNARADDCHGINHLY